MYESLDYSEYFDYYDEMKRAADKLEKIGDAVEDLMCELYNCEPEIDTKAIHEQFVKIYKALGYRFNETESQLNIVGLKDVVRSEYEYQKKIDELEKEIAELKRGKNV